MGDWPPVVPVLLNVGAASECCTNEALETLYKAAGDPPGDDPSIWRPHESTLIRALVEHFSDAGTYAIDALSLELHSWLAGHHFVARKPGTYDATPPKVTTPGAWSQADRILVESYLSTKPQVEWSPTDWQMLVDLLVNKHLPQAVIEAQAEHFVVKAYGMGGVQAAHGELPPGEAEQVALRLPGSVKAVLAAGKLTPMQATVLDFAKARCCANVVGVTEANRAKLRAVVLDHQERVLLGDRLATPSALQSKLLDTFGSWNRDWRRIAVSELGENLNQGLIAALPVGTKVQRVEIYNGACAFCRKIDGTVLTVAAPGAFDQDGYSEVWVGKTNLGRSASPNKRVGGQLVERLPAERWWLAAGIIHPHCRGRWIVLRETLEKSPPAPPGTGT